MKGKNCLIFGGSGQIGRHLIRKLTKNDFKVEMAPHQMPLSKSQIFINTIFYDFETQKLNNDRFTRRYFFQISRQKLLRILTVEKIMSETVKDNVTRIRPSNTSSSFPSQFTKNSDIENILINNMSLVANH